MSDHELRWQLRQLPREIDPPRDLWPGIADRLPHPVAPRRRPWFAALAVAASLCVAAGLAWQLRQPAAPAPDFRAELVQREAEALTREYQAALDQFQGAPLPEPLAPALATLDRSAADIREAIASDPEAVFLLDQLRRTYSRRLSLTQRAVTG
jgi:hypothetical protein